MDIFPIPSSVCYYLSVSTSGSILPSVYPSVVTATRLSYACYLCKTGRDSTSLVAIGPKSRNSI